MKPKIMGMTLTAQRPNAGGSIVIAYFDADLGPLTVFGVALTASARSGLVVWFPKHPGQERERRLIVVHDQDMRTAILEAALDAFAALGGELPDGVTRPPRPVEDPRPAGWRTPTAATVRARTMRAAPVEVRLAPVARGRGEC